MTKLLLIEDEISIATNLIKLLKLEGMSVQHCESLSATQGLNVADFDLVLLDWMLPDGQGIDYLKSLKNKYEKIPVIMLTARAEVTDKVLGLEIGADDYLTKPFDPRELVARIRVQLRNSSKVNVDEEHETLVHGDLAMNLKTREVTYQGRSVRFNKMEFNLLKFFIERPGVVFSRQELLDEVWGMDSFPTTRTVDQHVLTLRNKLDSSLIETIRAVGYRLI